MKINRQSVIRDDTQKFNSKIKDKSKSRINYRNDDDMKEDLKEDSFGSQDKKDNSLINKKTRKPLMKEVPGFPNELSSQRTDKNLLLKQNISKKSSEKASSNLDDLIIEEEEKNQKVKDQANTHIVETTGMKGEDEKNKKKERMDTVSSWEEESGEEEGTQDDKKEINKKWYKAYYLTNLAMKLNHGPNAVKYCDEMITLCDEPLNLDQIKIILASKFFIYKSIKKITKRFSQIIDGRKRSKKFNI